MRSTKSLLTVVVVGAAIFVGTALAANSVSFQDQSGDAFPAPDVVNVAVSNDDAGNVTVQVRISNRTVLTSGDEVTVGIDADQNPDTGSFFYGADFGLDLVGTNAQFLRPDADGFLGAAAAPASFQGSFAAGVATFSFKPAEVGMSSAGGFNVFAITVAKGGVDAAPEIRTFNYQPVAGTPPAALGPDRRPPVDEALKVSGVHGKIVRLRFFVADGRGETADTISVRKGARTLKTMRSRLSDTNPFFVYYALWRVPKNVRGKLRFCVSSVDRAGNKSNVSCAALTIR